MQSIEFLPYKYRKPICLSAWTPSFAINMKCDAKWFAKVWLRHRALYNTGTATPARCRLPHVKISPRSPRASQKYSPTYTHASSPCFIDVHCPRGENEQYLLLAIHREGISKVIYSLQHFNSGYSILNSYLAALLSASNMVWNLPFNNV